ncbi:glutamate--cysteine ligase, partial [Streptomyces cellulosae]
DFATVREADLPAGIDLLVTETRGDRLPARAAARRPRPQVATAHHVNGRSRLHPVTAPGTPG